MEGEVKGYVGALSVATQEAHKAGMTEDLPLLLSYTMDILGVLE